MARQEKRKRLLGKKNLRQSEFQLRLKAIPGLKCRQKRRLLLWHWSGPSPQIPQRRRQVATSQRPSPKPSPQPSLPTAGVRTTAWTIYALLEVANQRGNEPVCVKLHLQNTSRPQIVSHRTPNLSHWGDSFQGARPHFLPGKANRLVSWNQMWSRRYTPRDSNPEPTD